MEVKMVYEGENSILYLSISVINISQASLSDMKSASD